MPAWVHGSSSPSAASSTATPAPGPMAVQPPGLGALPRRYWQGDKGCHGHYQCFLHHVNGALEKLEREHATAAEWKRTDKKKRNNLAEKVAADNLRRAQEILTVHHHISNMNGPMELQRVSSHFAGTTRHPPAPPGTTPAPPGTTRPAPPGSDGLVSRMSTSLGKLSDTAPSGKMSAVGGRRPGAAGDGAPCARAPRRPTRKGWGTGATVATHAKVIFSRLCRFKRTVTNEIKFGTRSSSGWVVRHHRVRHRSHNATTADEPVQTADAAAQRPCDRPLHVASLGGTDAIPRLMRPACGTGHSR